MIVTISAALAYCTRIDPAATLAQACAAILPSEHVAAAAGRFPYLVVRTPSARIVVERGFVTNVWPLSVVVSRGPVS